MEDQGMAVLGVTKTCRTYVDGSLVIQIEIEPRHAQAAFSLFGAPGTPIAMARIMPEVAMQQARKQAIEADRPKGGELCKLAAQLCRSERFRAWLRLKYDPMPVTDDHAATIIKRVCGVDSRAYLDHDPVAATRFHEVFRLPYAEYQRGRS